MPTLECLDERTRAILTRLDQMDEKFSENFHSFRLAIEDRNKIIDKRLDEVEDEILKLKLQHAEESGKKSVMIWLGTVALTAVASILGAVGNAVYNWWVKLN